MEYRNLQTTSGGSTYIISLPKEWVKYQKLEKGRPLAMEERKDGALVIFPTLNIKKPQIEKEIVRKDEEVEALLRFVIGNYVNGVDQIAIKGKITWDEEKRLTRWIGNLLLGATVSREGKNQLLVTVALDEENAPPQRVLKRAHNISYWMYVSAVSQIAKSDSSLVNDIIDRDKEVDRLHVVCRRSLNKAILDTDFRAKIGLQRGEMSDHFRVMDYVELVADICCDLARRAEIMSEHPLGQEDVKVLEPLMTEVGELHNMAVKAFVTKNIAISNQVIGSAIKLMLKDIPKITEKVVPRQKSKEATAAISDSLNSMKMIAETSKHISEMNIDRCVRE